MNKIIVTGGSGFVGTQVVRRLKEAGHYVTVVDTEAEDIGVADEYIVNDYKLFFEHTKFHRLRTYHSVIHLAADHLVEPSILNPESYYQNNVVDMKNMLDKIVHLGIKNIIFSSTGNVYGKQGKFGPLYEHICCDPENAYASTKLAGEMLLKDYSRAYNLNSVIFRYFNVAGADPECRNGYTQDPVTHVIPVLCEKALNEEEFPIYGTDYATLDGTCVRDYVHLDDLANAHVLAIDYLNNGGKTVTLNLGGGSSGVSVNQLIERTKCITGKNIRTLNLAPRNGDPSMLIANIDKAKNVIGWEPKYNIDDCINHAYAWHRKINDK